MQAVDLEVLKAVQCWLHAGQSGWLCTVVQTFGSSPRPVGSLLACHTDGSVVGSLSGGCVEDDLLEKLRAGQLALDAPMLMKYGLAPEDTERLGLPCGGHLHVAIEPLHPEAETLGQFDTICAALEARQSITRIVNLDTGRMQVLPRNEFAPLVLHEQDGVRTLEHTYGARHQLFIVGAGMVAFYLAQMAQALDFQVTICDPREHLLTQWAVAGTRTLAMMPDDAVRAYGNDARTAIVTVTHDPRIDDMGLMEALKTNAFYVGAMGSERTSASRRVRLAALDLSSEEIARLRAPVGLPIGSKTPPEIAIAILAEITAVQKNAESRVAASLATSASLSTAASVSSAAGSATAAHAATGAPMAMLTPAQTS